jgi:hypothetical protein
LEELKAFKEWIVPISSSYSIIAIAVGSLIAVLEYRVKVDAEKRLADATTIESDVRLLKTFSEMVQLANSRNTPIVSEKAIDAMFQKGMITNEDLATNGSNVSVANMKMMNAVLIPPYGAATQEGAIASLYTLGMDHKTLRDPAIRALVSLKLIKGLEHMKEEIESYLSHLNKKKESDSDL